MAEVRRRALALGMGEHLQGMNEKTLQELFTVFDDVWFSGALGVLLREKGINQQCGTSPIKGKPRVAGYCLYKQLAKVLKINICKKEMCRADYFRQGGSPRTYSVNGILCSNPLDCMLHVFAHELVHAIIEMVCPLPSKHRKVFGKLREVREAHGPLFKKLALHIFGHTGCRHGLGNPVGNVVPSTHTTLEDVIKTKKEELKAAEFVWFTLNKQKVIGNLVSTRGSKRGHVKIDMPGSKNHGKTFCVVWEDLHVHKL